jgi:hypothetical protein
MRHAKIENGGGPIFTWRKGVRFLFFRELFPLYIYIYIYGHTHTPTNYVITQFFGFHKKKLNVILFLFLIIKKIKKNFKIQIYIFPGSTTFFP